MGSSARLYWELKKISWSLSAHLLLCWQKKIASENSFDLYFYPLIIEFFWFA